LTRKESRKDGSDNDSDSGGGIRIRIRISSKKNINDNDDSSDDDTKASTSTSFDYVAPSNWKKVKTRPGQTPYRAHEATGATNWAHHPPAIQYHKPITKQFTTTSYGFTKKPHEDPKDDVDTSVCYESPPLTSLSPPPTKKSALEITANLTMKMNLGGNKGLLNLANDLGVWTKNPDGTRLQNLEPVIAIKSHFKKIHLEEMTSIHDFMCYHAPPQKIDRKRKIPVDNIESCVTVAATDDQHTKRQMKKIPGPSLIVSLTFKNK
jgi:hypothetical protein